MNPAKPKILLVDDEPDILESLDRILRSQYEIDKAENGVIALEKMSQKSFDVVVCDFLMPKMDGITLLKNLRERKDYTPFVFVSGNADENHELKMASLGAYKLLQKADILQIKDVLKKTLMEAAEVKKLHEGDSPEDKEFAKIFHSS